MSRANHAKFTQAARLAGGVRIWMLASAVALSGLGHAAGAVDHSDADCRLTSQARQAIDDDAQLGSLHLGVSVRNNVATVFGAVPSAELSQRAVACLQRVAGVERVVNQLSIESPNDPLVDFLNLPARPLAMRGEPPVRGSSPAPGTPPIPPRRVPTTPPPATTRTAHGPVPVWQPASDSKLASRSAEPAAPLTMPSIPLPGREPATAPRAASTTPPSDNLALAVAQLQSGNSRLRGVRPEVRGGIVYLRGQVDSWEDLFAMARSISRLPGVERVVVDKVQAMGR